MRPSSLVESNQEINKKCPQLNLSLYLDSSFMLFLFQASDVSRSRGASLIARPGNSLVAAIRSQHYADSQQLSAPCKPITGTLFVFFTDESFFYRVYV